MDLIYTNKDREDVGVLQDYTLDLAFGSDENDFELTVDVTNHCCDEDCLVYIENTEYGGIIDGVKVVTKDDKLVYKGRTWHGILASKVIEPTSGVAYLTVSGDANTVIGELLYKISIPIFKASTESSGITIEDYQFDRYIDAYSGLTKMLASVSAKLKFEVKDGKVVLSAVPIVDYTQDEQFDSDLVEMDVEKTYNTVNHLICLGSGTLTGRQVIHLYADADGNISETRTFTSLQEIIAVYDYPNVESLAELKKSGIEKLKEYRTADKVQLNFASEDDFYGVGDIIGAKEITTGIYAKETIKKKIVTINQNGVAIQYKVGE